MCAFFMYICDPTRVWRPLTFYGIHTLLLWDYTPACASDSHRYMTVMIKDCLNGCCWPLITGINLMTVACLSLAIQGHNAPIRNTKPLLCANRILLLPLYKSVYFEQSLQMLG